jgi:hypothetical protein
MEDPEQRRFAVNILAEATRRRSELLGALLTIRRWGRVSGVETGKPLGSYEQWCSWARDPLLTLQCHDPVARIAEDKRRDPSRQAIVAMFDLWWVYHRDRPVTANDLNDDVKHAADPQGRGRQFLVAYLEKLSGTHLGGYILTRQTSAGRWGAATFKLTNRKTNTQEASDAPYGSAHRWSEKIDDGRTARARMDRMVIRDDDDEP